MRKQKGSKRREMEAQLSALRKEIGEKGWSKVEKVLEGDYDEDEWERVVGEALAGVVDGVDGDDAEDEGDDGETPTWDDEDDYGYGEEEVDGSGEGMDPDLDIDMDMNMDGPVNMVSRP